ncbi:hypothetical protein [Paraburkholderia kururiensis]|uniref:Surface antigen n=2 Tax=Paraburkholderia kururiensis TaxID=984307 RepID=A0ABZ0WSX1_9BURK|nr:hypothetical protein U0042_12050 [Paraburkholderia kururiensis]
MPKTFPRTLGFALAATLYGCAVPPPSEAVQPVAAVPLNDTLCRTITTTADIDSQPQTVRGTACRQPDGTWQTTDASPPTAVVYPGPYADYYDDWWYGAAPVTVVGGGFVFFDGFHHHHHGSYGGSFYDHGFHDHGFHDHGGFHGAGMHAWGGGMHGGMGGGMGGGRR